MLIERQRYSPNGAVSAVTFDEIKTLQAQAADAYIDFVRESGGLTGAEYVAHVIVASEVDSDLQPYLGGDLTDECLVEESTRDSSNLTTVFNLATQVGVQRDDHGPNQALDYYELDESYSRLFGFNLIGEVFEAGTYPELSLLASTKGLELIDPADLPARIMTPEEHKRARATAHLSQFTLAQLGQVIYLYDRVAYPDRDHRPRSLSDIEQFYRALEQGEMLGLRTGTKYLDCAKHILAADTRTDELQTRMYLNYDIHVGPVNLHFREDIDMAVEFGEKAANYFSEAGILVAS